MSAVGLIGDRRCVRPLVLGDHAVGGELAPAVRCVCVIDRECAIPLQLLHPVSGAGDHDDTVTADLGTAFVLSGRPDGLPWNTTVCEWPASPSLACMQLP